MTYRDAPRGRCRRAAWIALALAPIACAPAEARKPVAPARGVVLVEGKPAAGMLVVFHPTDDPVPNPLDPRAVVEADGTFAVSTHNARDGAPPGRYAVTIHDPAAGATAAEEGGAPAPKVARLPSRYANPATSGLEARVRPDADNSYTFRLTR